MSKKDFFIDHDQKAIINGWDDKYLREVISIWNKEVPEHIQRFNSYNEDRNSVIYFALFMEYHVNRSLEILFPDFNSFLDFSNTAISVKINMLASFRLFPKQIFEACRCINNIRNEFAHEFSITKIEELEQLPADRKRKTIDKLVLLTNEYSGDYDEYVTVSDTAKNRFKTLVMNTITAFRIYEPLAKKLREQIESNTFLKEDKKS
ncbi:hypothetical protein [Fluviicola sp.]|uniref:hypothetical protein n=1 Tax=Fluviicola sp. TaxID=1917219 RepID=UPI002635721B|nr:hypothetical protein [Fluviicola sp.]